MGDSLNDEAFERAACKLSKSYKGHVRVMMCLTLDSDKDASRPLRRAKVPEAFMNEL